MIGAITGDVIGSIYEGAAPRAQNFPLFGPDHRFTDDTVLTVAVAQAVRKSLDFGTSLRRWGRAYPAAGYGGMFRQWLHSDATGPYGSFGNGSAMRVSPIGWAFERLDQVSRSAARSAAVTHDHPEGIRGAQAVATAVFLARTGHTKDQIAAQLFDSYGYDSDRSWDELSERGGFDVTCAGTVPVAVGAFLHSSGFEDAVRRAVGLGGDTDTLACIAGAIAEAFYGGIPYEIWTEVHARLDPPIIDEVLACARAFDLPLPSPQV